MIVYTAPECGPCRAEKKWLEAMGVAFEDRNVFARKEWMEEIAALPVQSSPVTVIIADDGSRVVVEGFREAELRSALGW